MSDSSNLDSIGTIVSWRVPNVVSLPVLRAGLHAAGLDENLAGDMAPRNAFSRACREMKAERVIRKLRDEGTELVFQFTKEYLAGNHYDYTHECDVTLDKDTGNVTCQDPAIETLANQYVQEHMAKRLTSDLTRLIQAIFKKRSGDLVSLRDAGGVYFVPQAHQDLVEATHTLLVTIGGSLRRFKIQFGDVATNQSVGEAMADHLNDLIKQFRDSCDTVNDDSPDYVKDRRAKAVKELRSKLELHKGLLQMFADGIGTEIDKAEQDMLAKFMNGSAGAADVAEAAARPMLFPMF